MGPTNGFNPEKVNYFSLDEYIDRIKLTDNIMRHVEDTSISFQNYIKFLSNYPETVILDHLINSFKDEMLYSNKVEKHLINPEEIKNKNVYFDSLTISHHRIKELHQFVSSDQPNYKFDYRDSSAWVSYFDKSGVEHIFWHAAEPEDIEAFMNDFIKIYKIKGLQGIISNPFLKSALCHLLFLRIHPFNDGNGRTARLIYDMKFTEMINRLYGTNLKISPLHLSMSIYLNQITYVKKIDNIYFDIKHDCNDEINQFFDFILNITDEQINFMTTDESKRKLDELLIAFENASSADVVEEEIEKEASNMKIKKLVQ